MTAREKYREENGKVTYTYANLSDLFCKTRVAAGMDEYVDTQVLMRVRTKMGYYSDRRSLLSNLKEELRG